MIPRRLLLWVVFVAFALGSLLWSAAARAQVNPYWGHVVQNGGAAIEYVTGGARLVDGIGGPTFVGRTFSAASNGAAVAAETYAARIGGGEIALVAARTISAPEIAVAVAAGYLAFQGGFAVGTVLADYLGMGTRVVPTDHGWMADPGTAPTGSGMVPRTCWVASSIGASGVGTPPDAAPNCITDAMGAAVAKGQWSASPGWLMSADPAGCSSGVAAGGAGTCTVHGLHSIYAPSPGTTFGVWVVPEVRMVSVPGGGCAASFDFFDPAYNTPEGAAPGPDGKCRTGRYDPIGAAAAADRLRQFGDTSGTHSPDVVRDILSRPGGSVEVGAPANLSGPSSTVGAPTVETTTNPDGSTIVKTTTNTTNYTYNSSPNTVNYQNTVSVVTNNAGNITTVNTTVGPSVPPAKTPDPLDPCVANPTRMGCVSMGAPETTNPVWVSKAVSFDVEDLGFGSGSCPADQNFTFHGWALPLHFQPLCTAAPIIKLSLLAMVALSCMGFVVRTVTQ
jgi:hypothetical protein